MNIHKILLVIAVLGLTACCEKTVTSSTTPAGNAPAGPLTLPVCSLPKIPGESTSDLIQPACYRVCNVGGTVKHPGPAGMRVGSHVKVDDILEIRKVADVTNVYVHAKNVFGAVPSEVRDDSIWVLMAEGGGKTIAGPLVLPHTVTISAADQELVEVPHIVKIVKIAETTEKPVGCTAKNILEIQFCTEMTVNGNTQFLCENEFDPGDQGHAHAEN